MEDNFDDFGYEDGDFYDEYDDAYTEDNYTEEFSDFSDEPEDEEKTDTESRFDYDIGPMELAIALGLSEEIAEERRREARFRREHGQKPSETRRISKSEITENSSRKFDNRKSNAEIRASGIKNPISETARKKEIPSEKSQHDFSVSELLTLIGTIIFIIFLFRAC